jgi:hypothetical protein
MALSAAIKKLINNITPGAKTAKLGDLVEAGTAAATATAQGQVKMGAAVVNATDAASALTQINALLASLRAAGTIAP